DGWSASSGSSPARISSARCRRSQSWGRGRQASTTCTRGAALAPVAPDRVPDARGRLYVVATPNGNLGDVTLRAIETLRAVPLIAAEDTRIARRLLARHDIPTRLMSYHAQSGKARLDDLLAHLGGGSDLAVVTDAGTPAVS